MAAMAEEFVDRRRRYGGSQSGSQMADRIVTSSMINGPAQFHFYILAFFILFPLWLPASTDCGVQVIGAILAEGGLVDMIGAVRQCILHAVWGPSMASG